MIFAMIICAVLMSCGNSSDKPVQQEAQIAAAPVVHLDVARDSVVTITEPNGVQSYAIYYPARAKSADATPIIVCFDPHGDGRLPIDKYRRWANKFGVAIAGSNDSRNGLSAADGQQIASNMISDISSRLGFAKKNMAICGFSGGAKVAISTMSDPDLQNLIYAGAATQMNAGHPLNVLGFAGNQDMNYTDLLQFDESMSGSANSILIEFGGKHEWPDMQTFENAFYWLLLTSFSHHTIPMDSGLVAEYIAYSKAQISQAQSNGDLLKAHQCANMAAHLLHSSTQEGQSFSSYCVQTATSISAMPAYKQAMAKKSETIQKEANEKQVLMQAFQSQGSDWWAKVINGYKSSTNPSDKRLLGFISLACYSYSNQLLQQQNLDAAERILSIYEMCDGGNTDQLYFHAQLYAEKNNNELALKYLKKAISLGFTDSKKIEADPAFTALRNDPNYSPTVAALKKTSK